MYVGANIPIKDVEYVANIKKPDLLYTHLTSVAYNFNFERVLPGKYILWAFFDEDSNGVYSYGTVDPLEYAESFIFYPDTLELRARWPVGDIEINL